MATSAFGKAFRAARESGDKEFSFGGKKYNTKMAGPKTSTKSEMGPEMGSPMSASESKAAASRFGYPKGSERLNSEENKDVSDMAYKRGGKVSSASSRADGCCAKGKTKGTMVKMTMGGMAC